MIYADNAATTRISDSVFEKMLPFLREQYGNASSQYSLGVKAKRAVELARKQVSDAVGAAPSEIAFTSGGSEANSWVLHSISASYRNDSVHIITSAIEHPSVLNACRALENTGVEITFLPVDKEGRVSVGNVASAIKPHTKLVSIMLANNEIGTIQPVAEIGQLLRKKGILFHTDAVQAVGHIPVDANNLQVDFLTASAHKFNGPKGVGFLYIRDRLELSPLIFGGAQESGLRAGTENVAGIVATGYAIEECVGEMQTVSEFLQTLISNIMAFVSKRIPNVLVNGEAGKRLPGIINIGFDDISGEALMHLLDLKGICVSTSSACTSGKNEPSHVLLALGQTEEQAKSAIRISFGRYNTIDEAQTIATALCDAYEKITKAKL